MAQTSGNAAPSISMAVVQPVPSSDSLNLNAALSRLGRNPRDLEALIDAGNAAMAMGDADAAIGFFRRADEVAPGNPRVKSGLAGAMVRNGDPFTAIPLFEAAEKAGAVDSSIAADRGLAYDMVGDNETAQRLYKLAMTRSYNDEVVRRLALSLAMSGDRKGSDTALSPLLQRQDSAAWRTRAFALAILGRTDEAISIANTVLPQDIAASMAPYLRYMPRLTPSQQAAAANFGLFPRASDIGRDDSRVAQYAPAGGRRVNVATSEASLVPKGEPLGRRQRDRDRDRDRNRRTAANDAARSDAALRQERERSARAAQAPVVARTVASAGPVSGQLVRAAPGPAPASTPPPAAVQPAVRIAATPAQLPAPAVPTPVSAASAPIAAAPVVVAARPPAPVATVLPPAPAILPPPTPAPTVAAVPVTAVAAAVPAIPSPPSVVPTATPAVAPLAAPSLAIRPASPQPPAPVPVQPAPVPAQTAGSALPPATFDLARMAATPAPAPAPAPVSAAIPVSAPPAAGPVVQPVPPRRPSLAEAFGDLARPAVDPTPVAGAVDIRRIRPSRESEPEKLVAGKPTKPADAKPPPPSHPSRIWVQVAMGRDKAALASDWRRMARAAPEPFRTRKGAISTSGQSTRLLTGPFESISLANAFVTQLRRAEIAGAFVWTSPAGQVVDALPGR